MCVCVCMNPTHFPCVMTRCSSECETPLAHSSGMGSSQVNESCQSWLRGGGGEISVEPEEVSFLVLSCAINMVTHWEVGTYLASNPSSPGVEWGAWAEMPMAHIHTTRVQYLGPGCLCFRFKWVNSVDWWQMQSYFRSGSVSLNIIIPQADEII